MTVERRNAPQYFDPEHERSFPIDLLNALTKPVQYLKSFEREKGMETS